MLIPFSDILARYKLKPTGILHVGAWDGAEMEDYHREGIDRVLFIEAQEEIFSTLRGRIAPYPDARALHYCVSDKNEEVQFHRTSNGQSSSILELGTHKDTYPHIIVDKTTTMQAHTLAQIFLMEKIDISQYDFVNMDIQGAELRAIKGMGRLVEKIKAFYLEVNDQEVYKGCCLITELDEYLGRFGFDRVETKMVSNHGWGDAFYLKNDKNTNN